MKWLAIINPRSARHTHSYWQSLMEQLRRSLGADCTWTRYPGHASQIVRRAPGYDGFIATGGDGTIAEVVNGLDLAQHCLGIIPTGTGNGLARDLNLHNPAAAIRALVRERFVRVDLIETSFRA